MLEIRAAQDADAGRISELVLALSGHFLAGSEAQAQAFLASLSPAGIAALMARADMDYLLCEQEGRLLGVVAVVGHRHIYHWFVAVGQQGRGIGKKLWAVARERAEAAGNLEGFTVNASLGAVPVYRRLGFVETAPRQEKNGVTFLPMRLSP